MSQENPKTSVWNQAEELVGTYPSGDELRSAIHAVITKGMHVDARSRDGYAEVVSRQYIINNMEYLAREYEAVRGTTQTVESEVLKSLGL